MLGARLETTTTGTHGMGERAVVGSRSRPSEPASSQIVSTPTPMEVRHHRSPFRLAGDADMGRCGRVASDDEAAPMGPVGHSKHLPAPCRLA